ncbi:MAG: ABC transporter ATP-binding protein [Clostridia bacterium]|nr:ABC transporter ATP-binding protein [Clostridia bacterium]
MMNIEIKDYTKIIRKKTVLEDISLSMTGGDIWSFTGGNGAGKTMLLRAISGLILPTKGYVSVNGEIIGKDISFPRDMGLELLETTYFSDLSGFENLRYLASIKKKATDQDIEELMDLFRLERDMLVRDYSQGMKQKLNLIQAMMEGPELLLLDEPSDSLDDLTKTVLYDRIRSFHDDGSLVIIATHDQSEIQELSTRTILIEQGRVKDIR